MVARMDEIEKPESSSVRLWLSSNVSYALIIGLLVGVFGAGRWLGTQASSSESAIAAQGLVNVDLYKNMARVEALSTQRFATSTARFELLDKREEGRVQQAAVSAAIIDRLGRLETGTGARLDSIEKRDELRAAQTGAIDNRLTRIEAQIAFLVAAVKK